MDLRLPPPDQREEGSSSSSSSPLQSADAAPSAPSEGVVPPGPSPTSGSPLTPRSLPFERFAHKVANATSALRGGGVLQQSSDQHHKKKLIAPVERRRWNIYIPLVYARGARGCKVANQLRDEIDLCKKTNEDLQNKVFTHYRDQIAALVSGQRGPLLHATFFAWAKLAHDAAHSTKQNELKKKLEIEFAKRERTLKERMGAEKRTVDRVWEGFKDELRKNIDELEVEAEKMKVEKKQAEIVVGIEEECAKVLRLLVGHLVVGGATSETSTAELLTALVEHKRAKKLRRERDEELRLKAPETYVGEQLQVGGF